MSRSILLATIGVAGAAITVGAVLVFLQLQELERLEKERIALFIEYLGPEDSASIEIRDPDASDMIGLNARWNKSVVTMSVSYDETIGIELRDGSLERIKEALQPGNGTFPYSNWNDLLYKLKMQSDRVPVLEYTDNFDGADIKLYLTNDSHPEGKVGFTRLGVDKETKEILFAEMRGFELDGLVDSNINVVALQHGIGHALGISHTNYKGSVMYADIVSVDGIAIGELGPCEENAITQIYIKGILEPVSCESNLIEQAD